MSFQLATDASQNHMVLALGPFTDNADFGAEFPIFTIEDDSQRQIVLDNLTTYLCTDEATVKTEPC